jgi:hypothetical protein
MGQECRGLGLGDVCASLLLQVFLMEHSPVEKNDSRGGGNGLTGSRPTGAVSNTCCHLRGEAVSRRKLMLHGSVEKWSQRKGEWVTENGAHKGVRSTTARVSLVNMSREAPVRLNRMCHAYDGYKSLTIVRR